MQARRQCLRTGPRRLSPHRRTPGSAEFALPRWARAGNTQAFASLSSAQMLLSSKEMMMMVTEPIRRRFGIRAPLHRLKMLGFDHPAGRVVRAADRQSGEDRFTTAVS